MRDRVWSRYRSGAEERRVWDEMQRAAAMLPNSLLDDLKYKQPAPGGHVTACETSLPDLLWRNANGDHVVHEDLDEAEVDRD